ncbi:MAG: DNA repair exonuclease [archaeon]
MKFGHLADCHLDAWREQKLKALSLQAFEQAVSTCIREQTDFVLICGDLFNTALPNIDVLKFTVSQLERLKQASIPVYIIPGSHDVTHTGKSMIDVLEEARLVKNVFRGHVEEQRLRLHFTHDKKTGVKLTGMLGRRGMLEKNYYEHLDADALEREQGEKLFLFHTALDELKSAGMSHSISSPLSFLPKNFLYYAGGHVHEVIQHSFPHYQHIVYPGPLFPNSFSELEQLEHGGFFIYSNGTIIRKDLPLKKVLSITVSAEHSTPAQVTAAIKDALTDVHDAIITLRVEGCLASGKTADVPFNEIMQQTLNQGAYAFLKNTAAFTSEQFEEFKKEYHSAEELESAFLHEHAGQVKTGMTPEEEIALAKKLMSILSVPREDGEKVYSYEDRMRKQGKTTLGLE